MVIGAKVIKQIAASLGAELCGIAPVARFEEAPAHWRPETIYPDCRSVIVFARPVPAATLNAASLIPYSHALNVLSGDLDRLGLELCIKLEELGIGAVPLPCNATFAPPAPGTPGGTGFLDLPHAACLAGLGVIGKNTLLINKVFGSMIHLGAVLVDADLEPDPLAGYQACPPHCRACLDACPAGALDGMRIRVERCREASRSDSAGAPPIEGCIRCRQACPSHLGL